MKTPEFINNIFEYLKIKNNLLEKNIDDGLDFFGSYYKYFIILLNVLYIFVFFGLLSVNYIYVNYLNIFIQLFTSIFLLLRFHPFRKHFITKYDSTIITHSAIFLLINLLLVEGVKNVVQHKFEPEPIKILQTIIGEKLI
jgi:hypothetical protein